MSGPAVREASPADAPAWDAYVRSRARATPFHLQAWRRVLERGFRYRPRYLLAERGGELAGVLPLFACRTLLGSKALYSLPHTVYGGPLADDDATTGALHAAARDLAREVGAPSIELRNRHPSGLELAPVAGFVTFEKALPATPEEINRTIPKKSRNLVNQAVKRRLLEADVEGGVEEFYPLFAANYLKLGSPVFPRRFFDALVEEFADDASVLLVRHEGRPVVGVVSVGFRGTFYPLYSGEAEGYGHLHANNFKVFALQDHAVRAGFERLDLGRSYLADRGNVAFKRHQGFEPEPLPYQVDPLGGGAHEPPDPYGGVLLKARSAWSRLPLGVANRIGPHVLKYFP